MHEDEGWFCHLCKRAVPDPEIARLRGDVWEWRRAADAEAAERRAAHADIERLRAEVERLTFELKAKSNEVQIADAEIERLQLIIQDAYDELRDVPGVDAARAALAAGR